MVSKKEKFGMGKIVFISVAAILVATLLLAVVVVNGVSQVTQTFIRSNPETIDKLSMLNAALNYDDTDLILSLLWAKYASGSVGGKVEGSFTGRFTTTMVRSLEKVNLSCIDEYEYKKAFSFDNYEATIDKFELYEEEQQLQNKGCTRVYTKMVVPSPRQDVSLLGCPLHNCQMREKTTEVAGQFIPEHIDIRKVEAESTLNK